MVIFACGALYRPGLRSGCSLDLDLRSAPQSPTPLTLGPHIATASRGGARQSRVFGAPLRGRAPFGFAEPSPQGRSRPFA